MKRFVVFIGKLLLITLLSAVLLDIAYTSVYLKTTERNKVEAVINSKNKSFDVIFMGSSRTHNHMIAKIFKEKGLNTFNYGMSASKLDETALLLKIMIENKYKIKHLILDVDLNLNSNSYSNSVRAMFMPYLHSSATIQQHYQNIPEYNKFYYIPFYRYIENDAKIGFREMYSSLVHKETNALHNDGFYPLLKNQRPMVATDLSKYYPKKNKAYEEIKAICQRNNIHLIAVTTPICMSTINREYFNYIQKVYPEVQHFENAVTDDKYFSSCGHMNKQGATVYTNALFNALFKPKTKS